MGKKTQIAFSFDTTSSMYQYLERVRSNLDTIIQRLFDAIPDIEIGIVAHGDYEDRDLSYVTKYLDFCNKDKVDQLHTFLNGITHTTGGDLPECYELVLHEAQTKFSWETGCYGALVMIGDAIPHEQEEDNNPQHLCWKTEARKLVDRGVRIHAVQCPTPEDDDIPGADEFWKELAELGGGKHLTLSDISQIVDVFVAICMHEADSTEQYTSSDPDVVTLLTSLKKTADTDRPVVRPKTEEPVRMADNYEDQSNADVASIPPGGNTATASIPLPDYTGAYTGAQGFGDNDGFTDHAHTLWRDIKLKWDEEEYKEKRNIISSRSPLLDESHTYKILLCGAIKAGKSSVINTIFTALRNEIGQIAFNAEDDKSITSKFRVYRLRQSVKQRAIRVTLCDTMGFEQSDAQSGPSIRDFEYIMDGHIKDGYEFKPNDSISFNSPYFKKDPGPMDKVHAVVVVVDSNTALSMSKEVVDKLKEVTNKANQREIRWSVIMTKIDQACGKVDEDISTVFSCQTIADFVENINHQLGAITSNIFPIKNYGSQVQVDLPMNILALHTLENILRLADNTLECQAGALPVDAEPQPVIELMSTPWRNEDKMSEEEVNKLWTELSDIPLDRVDRLRICVIGPSGAGKSAYINSCMSEFYQRIVTFAETGCGNSPNTTSYREYALKRGREGPVLDVELIDTMGIMEGNGGILTEDMTTVLDGKAVNTAPFNPAVPLSRPDTPTSLGSRMHLMILVVNGAKFNEYSPILLTKIKQTMDIAKASPREIPRFVLVTHIDEVCTHVKEDPSKVFRSLLVKQLLEKVHEKLQVPLVDIQPVVNYHNDTEIEWKKSALVLQALSHQVERAQDYIAAAPAAPGEPKEQKKKGWFW